jgi:predicted secreted protein
MFKRLSCLTFSLFVFIGTAFAGDIAQFVNLGFSEDSRYFLFAQYGVQEDSQYPYVEAYFVDIPQNDFVPNGSYREIFQVRAGMTQEGQGALYTMLQDLSPKIQRYNIDHLRTGRYLYLYVNGTEPKSELSFRDFENSRRFFVTLFQRKHSNGASFYIDLVVISKDGSEKQYTIGIPGFIRGDVDSYKIIQVLYTPDENSVVFIVEKAEKAEKGLNYRYMVETVRL